MCIFFSGSSGVRATAPMMGNSQSVVGVVSKTDSLKGHSLPWQHFHKGVWSSLEPTRHGKEGHTAAGSHQANGTSGDVFTLVTFNVWFSTHRLASRAEELIRIIVREDADFVCLQEVTVRFLAVFLADSSIQARYCVSSTADGFEALANEVGYDSYMICKKHLVEKTQLYRYRLTSKFARSVFVCFGPSFSVATVHLESCEGNQGTRAIQMGQIYRLLEEFGVHNKTFLCGDMNHCPTLGENHFPSSSFDLWPVLHPEEDGWTENALINLMLASKPGKHPLVRFDRIVMTGAETDRAAREIRILGTEPIQQLSKAKETVDLTLSEQIWTSDHFGLVAKFQKK